METTAVQTNMEKIKAGIWDIHEGVTSGDKKQASDEDNIMKGTLPRFKYVNNLKQRYILQREFEKVLGANRQNPYVAAVVTDEQFHADKSAQDLRFFGADPETAQPVSSTVKMIEFFKATAASDPRVLLAIHYTIEGSNNGGMHIARAVKQAYGLEGTDGTYHLQPYGPAIRDKWKAWGEAFNSLDMDDALMTKMVKAGRQTFHFMNDIATESYQQQEN